MMSGDGSTSFFHRRGLSEARRRFGLLCVVVNCVSWSTPLNDDGPLGRIMPACLRSRPWHHVDTLSWHTPLYVDPRFNPRTERRLHMPMSLPCPALPCLALPCPALQEVRVELGHAVATGPPACQCGAAGGGHVLQPGTHERVAALSPTAMLPPCHQPSRNRVVRLQEERCFGAHSRAGNSTHPCERTSPTHYLWRALTSSCNARD